MSVIEKLLIRGIRSFDPDAEAAIYFYTPLTLIVGHNGAGKTTIIESLKFATIGDMPPNSQKSFVHDPRVANTSQVKAQVKLQFCNVNGKRLVITRSLCLTQKKAVMTQKTLESLLAHVTDDNKLVSITSKCAELDAAIPEQLGVSKAILDNVIFCHQEESYWPLAEPSILKKKFDEIFASTRYTKALESIKSLRKDQTAQIKVDYNELEHLKLNRERADSLSKDREEMEERIAKALARKSELESGEIEVVSSQLRNLEREQQKLQNLYSQIQQHEMKRNMLAASIEEMKAVMEIFEDSDEDLKTMLKQYQESVQRESANLYQLEEAVMEATRHISEKESEIGRLLTSKGQMQAEVDAHTRRISQGDQLFTTIASSLNIRGFSAPFGDADIAQFLRKLNDNLETQIQLLEVAKVEAQAEQSSVRTRLQKVQNGITSQQETKKMLKRQMDTQRQKIASTTANMHSLAVSQNEIADANARIAEEESWIATYKKNFRPAEADAKIRSLSEEMHVQEAKVVRLTAEIGVLSSQGETQARLNLKLQDKKKKEDGLKTIMTPFKHAFKNVFNRDPNLASCGNEITVELRNKEKSSTLAKEKFDNQSKHISSLEGKLVMTKNRLQALSKDVEVRSKQISEVCPPGVDFLMAYEEAETEYDEELGSEKTITSANVMIQKYMRLFNKDKCCPLCARGFDTDSDAQKFLKRLQDTLSKIPNKDEQAAALAEKSARFKKFQGLKTLYNEIQRLRDAELPPLKQSIRELEKEIEEGRGLFEDLEEEVSAMKAEVNNLQELRMKCDEVSKCSNDIKALDGEIDNLQTELSISGSLRTSAEAQEEQKEAQLKGLNLRREVDRLKTEFETRQRELQNHENLLQQAKSHLTNKTLIWQRREELEASISEMKSEMEKFSKDMEVADSVANELLPSVRALEEELESASAKSSKITSAYEKSIQENRTHISNVESFQAEVKRFKETNTPARLDRCLNEVQALRAEINHLQTAKDDATNKISAIQKSTSEVTVLQRGINDNLKYREQMRAMAEVDQDIARLKTEAAQKDIGSVQTQRRRLTEKYEGLCEELAGLSGELKQMQEQSIRIEKDLHTNFGNIVEKHSMQVVKLKTETLAIQDLEKYSKALENAIMKYHSMKMDEINKIIRELWVNTYKGNDIETIEIRSDNENSTAKNRSYNYRVVMIKEQTELDMRGRCSAGQKVLACLIIRLALAETFCLNCGILALDEPTTNLDRDNSEALAESLSNIIKLRRAQKNFQLIIITHDEDFMNQIGHHDYADYYWRVSKDAMQHSIIERQTIV
ncbi:DNA repair protein rad50 [Chytriomyces hyalinus]|nr:DNA repair protein rad50 [Chytriomyces hyalinus]